MIKSSEILRSEPQAVRLGGSLQRRLKPRQKKGLCNASSCSKNMRPGLRSDGSIRQLGLGAICGGDPSSAARMTLGTFTGRLLIILVIAAVAVAVWQLTDILVLLFGAVLLSIGLCAAAQSVARHTGISRSLALALVFVLGLCVFGAALWVFGSSISAQMGSVIEAAPTGYKLFMTWMTGNPYGQHVLDQVRGANMVDATGWATSMVTSIGVSGRYWCVLVHGRRVEEPNAVAVLLDCSGLA